MSIKPIFTRSSLFSANGLVINTAKCVFAVSSLEFLGHQITSAGVVPLSRHVDAIQHFPQPKDIKQLQRFLGLVNFYRRFIPGIAGILKQLTDALADNPKTLIRSDIRNIAFEQAKKSLIKATLLVHPDVNARLSLADCLRL